MRVDLHTHSTASDGTDAPADLPRLAKAAGLDAFALTDHDTTAGLAPAATAAQQASVTFVPGIELSVHPDPFITDDPAFDADEAGQAPPAGAMHLLGYHIDPTSEALAKLQTDLREARATRNPLIIDRLRELGVRIDYDDVLAVAHAGETNGQHEADPASNDSPHAVGRPHIAQVLVERGYVKSIHEAFARYLGQGAAAYIPRRLPTAPQAIDAVHAAGGAVVLAHPALLGLGNDDLEHHLARLADLGLDGVETHHPDHEAGDTRRLAALAERFDLVTTGGSDYHGSRKAIELGSVLAPPNTLQRLEDAASHYNTV